MAYIDSRFINRMNINVRERYEVKVWCQLFNCSRKQLMGAVEHVGNNAGKVKKFIKAN